MGLAWRLAVLMGALAAACVTTLPGPAATPPSPDGAVGGVAHAHAHGAAHGSANGRGVELPDYDRRRDGPRVPAPLATAQVTAWRKLREVRPDVRVDWDELRRTPKVVAAARGFLTGPGGEGLAVPPGRAAVFGGAERHAGIKAFLAEHAGLFGQGAELLEGAEVVREFTARHNGLRTVAWQQRVDGIPVHEGVLIGHETARGEVVSLSTLMIPAAAAAAERGTPGRAAWVGGRPPVSAAEAVRTAAVEVGEPDAAEALTALDGGEPGPGPEQRGGAGRPQRFRVGRLPGEARAALVWLPLDGATLRLVWSVEITRRAGGERHRVLVDAISGEPRLRQRLTIYAADATYRVFTGDSPSPFSPGWATPNTNQPPVVPRRLVTMSALSTNASPLGWIPEGANETRGNNVDAHTDLDADDEPDLPRPQGRPFRVFDFPLDLEAAPSASADAAVTQLFYWCNWTHDRLYDLGFVEAAGNFQKDNFGRGGAGSDAMVADAQDGSGVNNANFTPAPDGEPGRIQMFVWTGPTPDRDGDFDAEVVIHEYVHGLTTRMVGGGVGMNTLQAAGLGEGWSDFYALCFLSEASDDLGAAYPFGAYAAHQLSGLWDNYYFGIRRYPYSTDLTKNPLTFRDIDPLQAQAYPGIPRNPLLPFIPVNAAEVHAQGEVWCAMLWDARAELIRRLGPVEGNERMLRLVTDGLKLCPPNPNFVQARDAILLADLVSHAGAHHPELWRAFARRGLGAEATSPDSATTVGVVESRALPDALLVASAEGWYASGPPGGPFAPACVTFPLTNLSAQPLRWVALAGAGASWLRIGPASGILPAGGATNVTVCLTDVARGLEVGTYSDVVVFANQDSGVAQRRTAELRVMRFRELPFEEGFETGEVEDYWSVSGTGRHRAQVSRLNEPRAGEHHLILDADSGVRSRNELTLGLDLAGYTNVVLRFWARSFGDEPDAPPPGPFVGGADFDGVAVSEDGVVWHEVLGLRDLTVEYAERVVDLDAAVAARGLRYTSSFRLRFNQFDDFQVPFDGIALDDIRLTGVPAGRFQMAVPPSAREGAGELPARGEVRLGRPVAGDLRVNLTSSHPERVSVPANVWIPAGSDRATFPLQVPDNDLLDGTERAVITASASGYHAGAGVIDVFDNETAALRVSLPRRAREGDGLLARQGLVRADARPQRDVRVALRSSLPGRLRVPAEVVLPAGARDVEFDLTVLDDSRITGSEPVTVTAHVENWKDGADTLLLVDNDAAALAFELPPSIGESNGRRTNAGIIRLSGFLPTNLVVTLASSDPGEVRVPSEVLVPAGQLRAGFDVEAVDDGRADGRQSVGLVASAPGFAGVRGAIDVLDAETPVVPYRPQPEDGATNVALGLLLSWGTGRGELLVNGGFETGDFTGWTAASAGYGAWVVDDGTFDPDGPEPATSPLAGNYHALTVQIGAGTHRLSQVFRLPPDVQSATLSWTDRIRNHANYFASPNQEYRVEIRDPEGAVLETAFQTSPGDTNFLPATRREWDLTRHRGRAAEVAFFQQDNLGYLNVALDDVRLLLGGDAGGVEYDVYFGGSANLGAGEKLGTTTNGFWALPALKLNTQYYWQIAARRGSTLVRGPVWRFRTRGVGEVDRFEFAPLGAEQVVGREFAVSVTARDDIGNAVRTFAGPVQLRGVAGSGTRSQVLISEVDVGPNDQVEFVNASGRALDLSGWSIVLYDGTSWPQPLVTVRVPEGAWCAAGGLFVLNDRDEGTGSFPDLNAGTNINWSASALGNPVAVLLLDAAGEVVDLAVAGSADAALIRAPRRIPAGEWRGPPVVLATIPNSGFTLQRSGTTDTDAAADWEVAPGTYRGANPGLVIPMPRRDIVAVRPAVLTPFLTGVWAGYVTVDEPVGRLVLEAEDGSGRWGLSRGLAVGARDDIAVAWDDPPDTALLGEVVTWHLSVTNTGPGRAEGVVLTQALPEGMTLVDVTTFYGGCAPADGGVRCEFEPIGAGQSARVTVRAEAGRSGALVSSAAVIRTGPDGYEANNRAETSLVVSGPWIVSTNLSLTEGSSATNLARFPVLLSAASRWPVTVAYATSNGTAQAGLDFVPVAGVLTFPPGVTNLSVTVPVIPDRLDEGSEQFTLNLVAATNGVVLGLGQARARINDDDPAPALTLLDASVIEGGPGVETMMDFVLRLSAPSALGVQVNYATIDGTAIAPLDYRKAVGMVSFPEGVTQQVVRVAIRGDRRYEPDEWFQLKITGSLGVVVQRPEATGVIRDDDAAEVDRLEWGPVSPLQHAGFPFAAGLIARDGLNRVAVDYTGPVTLGALAGRRDIAVGTGTNLWAVPLGAFFHDSRATALYRPAELGGAGSLNGLSLDVETLPGQSLGRWTIRLKHSPAANLAQAGWELDGWTTVYQGDLNLTEPGWVAFPFRAPFVYNGVDALLVDFSFDNGAYTTDGLVRSSDTEGVRTLFFRSDSAFGDPLAWEGNRPPPERSRRLPNLRFQFERPLSVSPSGPVDLVAGQWLGTLSVAEPESAVFLRATDAWGRPSDSPGFDVASGVDADGDGVPDAWRRLYFGDGDGADGRAEADPDGDGWSNRDEFRAGSNPLSPLGAAVVTSVTVLDGAVRMTLWTEAGRRYVVEAGGAVGREGPGGEGWQTVWGPVLGRGGEMSVALPIAGPWRFYRVRVDR